MYINRVCPLVNRQTQVLMGAAWQCSDPECRFQIDGACAIIGSFIEAKETRVMVNQIAQALLMKRP